MNKFLFALDLSMECSGITIFDLNKIIPVYTGSIQTNAKQTHGKRLRVIGNELDRLRELYPPNVIAIERGFSQFNTSTQVSYRVHGICNYLFHDINQVYYPPKKVKDTILNGKATKKEVSEAIRIIYTDIEFANEDESDSFAVALTYLINNKLIIWVKPEKPVKAKKVRVKKEVDPLAIKKPRKKKVEVENIVK